MSGATAREIRDYAATKGITVPSHGKLPWWVIAQWNKAFPDRPYTTGRGFNGWGAKEQNFFNAAQRRDA